MSKAGSKSFTNKGESQRINTFIAHQGVSSRREADVLIERGWVQIDNQTIEKPGAKVENGQTVTISPQAFDWLGSKSTVVINKPPGYVSHLSDKDYPPAIRLILPENYFGPKPIPKVSKNGLAPAGRLDIDSTGLLILTQDGRLAQIIIGENSPVEKEYIVKVSKPPTKAQMQKLSGPLTLDEKALKPATVDQINETQIRFVLQEGRKRQIRRMCELADLHVQTLKRIRVGPIELGTLPRGQWRTLNPQENF